MAFHALTVEVPEPNAEEIAALLLADGAIGAEIRDATLAPMPGSARPPPGRALVVAFFATRHGAASAAAAQGLIGTIAAVADQDWSETWKRGLGAISIGRVFVRPSWIDAPTPPGAVEVVLDPGMAFGTGTHPTTALCLRALDRLLGEHPGVDVLDVGTGSGLLAIGAKKLGAGRVVGTENDPVALQVAAENAARNEVTIELLLEDPRSVRGTFGVVVANILANTLLELAPAITGRLAPGGTVVLSGILAGQESEVRVAYAARGLEPRVDLDASEGEWCAIALRSHGGRRTP